jgi:acyl-CoA thioesterase
MDHPVSSEEDVPFLRTLGIRVKESSERHAIVEVDVREGHGNYRGGAHGGLVATLVDTVCFFPKPFLPSGVPVATTHLAVSYVRPADVGDHLTSRCDVVHLGRRTASLTVRVTRGDGALIAHGTVGLMILREAT